MKILKKYSITIIICIITVIIGVILITNNKRIKEFKSIKASNNTFKLSYNSTWDLIEKNNEKMIFEHGSGSKIIITTDKVDTDKEYLPLQDLIADIIYELNNNNNNYKLITESKEDLTKKGIPGYKLLYEKEDKELLVNIFKKNNKIITITYEATFEYFDKLLESVNEIIYNLEIEEEVYNVQEVIDLQLTPLTFPTNENLDKKLGKTITNTISHNNYSVTYTKPDMFKKDTLDTTTEINSSDETGYNIKLTTKIDHMGIYEELDKERVGNIFSQYKYYTKEEYGYEDFKETVSKYGDNSYIYRNTYYKIDKIGDNRRKINSIVVILTPLDKNHTFIFEIQAQYTEITEKLIKMFSIKEIKNYAKDVTLDKEDDYKVFNLKIKDYTHNKIREVKVKVPAKYEEIDNNDNKLEKRKFFYGYNSKRSVNNYEITYQISTIGAQSHVDIYNDVYIKKEYGEYKDVSFVEDLTLNNNKFSKYYGFSTYKGGIMFTSINRELYKRHATILFVNLEPEDADSKIVLMIEIIGNGYEITDEMLEELTHVELL